MNNNRTGRIRFKDGAAVPKTLDLTYDGEFNMDCPGVTVTPVKDRGELTDPPEFLLGDEMEQTGGCKAKVSGAGLNSVAVATLGSIVFGENGVAGSYVGANWVSTTSNTPAVFTLDVEHFDGTHTKEYRDCVVRGKYTEGEEGNMIDVTIMCPHPYPTVS